MENEKADKIIHLLEDIKELQQQHNDNYKTALRNQAESIQRQSEAIDLQKKAIIRLPLIVILALVLIGMLYFLLNR